MKWISDEILHLFLTFKQEVGDNLNVSALNHELAPTLLGLLVISLLIVEKITLFVSRDKSVIWL